MKYALPVLLSFSAALALVGAPVDVTVTVDKSVVLEQPCNIKRISITNGDIAEAAAVSPKEVLLNGKAQGDTTLLLWDIKGGRLQYDVHVLASTTQMDAVRGELANEVGPDVSLTLEGKTVFLRGTVADPIAAERAAAIAATMGKVINLLHVAVPMAEPQILLKVRFASVNRNASQQLGTTLAGVGTGGNFSGGLSSSSTAISSGGTLSNLINVLYTGAHFNLGAAIQALESKSLLEILAEPNLLTVSGKPASFLAGGEFPFPTIQGGAAGVGQITVQFKEFGIRLNFLPTITPRGTIRMTVSPEVSSLDYANGLVVSGFTVPGLATRRVQTEVELESGQSFVIAGLLNNQVQEQLNKIPGLGNVPVLGKLFQSKSVSKSNTELLVMVTPELVRPIPQTTAVPALTMPTKFIDPLPGPLPEQPGSKVTGPVAPLVPVETLPAELMRSTNSSSNPAPPQAPASAPLAIPMLQPPPTVPTPAGQVPPSQIPTNQIPTNQVPLNPVPINQAAPNPTLSAPAAIAPATPITTSTQPILTSQALPSPLTAALNTLAASPDGGKKDAIQDTPPTAALNSMPTMFSPKLTVYLEEPSLRREALDLLLPMANELPFEHHAGDWNSLLYRLNETKPEAILLDLSSVPGDLTAAIRQMRTHVPRLKVIALHSEAEPQTILSAMRAGATEFLHPPLAESLHPAITRILESPDLGAVPSSRGKIIGFLSSKGGCGATTVACHVAAELQALTKKSTLLADLDLTSGLVSFLMKTPSSYSILDALKNIERLDESLWKALLVEKSGLSVIPAPVSYTRWDHPDEEQLRQVLRFTRTQHDWIILDLGRSLNSIASAVLEEVDHLFLVSTLEVVALHGLKTIIHGLFAQGEKLQLILNRTPKTMDISTQELEKVLGRSIYAALPNDYMSLYQSYSSGNLLDKNNRLAQQFNQLASKIAGVRPEKSKKKFALFG